MKRFVLLLIVIVALSFGYSCKKESVLPESEIEPSELFKIMGFNSNNSFIDSKGSLFFPWGFNYTNPVKVGLIEDNWAMESTWTTFDEDFSEMRNYGANIVRIHLQYNKFMIDKATPNTLALNNLKRFVELAEVNGLYLDITGLSAYRKTDAPDWYDNLKDSERWKTHAIFWKNVAATIGSSKAVFSYNLMNEPVVAVGCEDDEECDWLPGDGFGGFHFIQNIARDPNLVYGTAMKDWIEQLTASIRSEDSETMITVGFLGLGPINDLGSDLEYLSLHIYPKSGELQTAVDKVENSQTSKPLVLEETSNLNCGIEELKTFLDDIDGNYNGLMGHYFGKTLADMQESTAITDALHTEFLEFFIANNPN